MTCPRCEQDTLVELDRHGITIDRCEKCRGIWLDRGELEKLVARESGKSDDRDDARPAAKRPEPRDERDDRRRRDDDDDDDDNRRGGRRGGFLSNLFDFD